MMISINHVSGTSGFKIKGDTVEVVEHKSICCRILIAILPDEGLYELTIFIYSNLTIFVDHKEQPFNNLSFG